MAFDATLDIGTRLRRSGLSASASRAIAKALARARMGADSVTARRSERGWPSTNQRVGRELFATGGGWFARPNVGV